MLHKVLHQLQKDTWVKVEMWFVVAELLDGLFCETVSRKASAARNGLRCCFCMNSKLQIVHAGPLGWHLITSGIVSFDIQNPCCRRFIMFVECVGVFLTGRKLHSRLHLQLFNYLGGEYQVSCRYFIHFLSNVWMDVVPVLATWPFVVFVCWPNQPLWD